MGTVCRTRSRARWPTVLADQAVPDGHGSAWRPSGRPGAAPPLFLSSSEPITCDYLILPSRIVIDHASPFHSRDGPWPCSPDHGARTGPGHVRDVRRVHRRRQRRRGRAGRRRRGLYIVFSEQEKGLLWLQQGEAGRGPSRVPLPRRSAAMGACVVFCARATQPSPVDQVPGHGTNRHWH